MTVLGQFVGFAGRSVGSVIGGDGSAANPWKFEFQSKDGGSSVVPVVEDADFFFEYLPLIDPLLIPPGFNPAGGDLVSFRPCEALFQGFPGGPFVQGVTVDEWLLMGWVTYTLHWQGTTYADATPYAVLVDPKDAGAYVLANYQEFKNISP